MTSSVAIRRVPIRRYGSDEESPAPSMREIPMAGEVLRHSKAAGVALVLTEDAKFQVRSGDEVLVETKVQSYAEIAYDEAVDERTFDLQARRSAEQAHLEISAVRRSSLSKAGTVRRKGGWAGR